MQSVHMGRPPLLANAVRCTAPGNVARLTADHLQRELVSQQHLGRCVAEREVEDAGAAAAVIQHGGEAHVTDLPRDNSTASQPHITSWLYGLDSGLAQLPACTALLLSASRSIAHVYRCINDHHAELFIGLTFAQVWHAFSTTFDDLRSPCSTCSRWSS